jgi:hypothetical protein
MKNNKVETIVNKVKEFMSSVKHVNSFTGDNFFDSKAFKDFVEEKEIDLYTGVSKDDHFVSGSNKLGVIDRLTRTLKSIIKRRMVAEDDVKWTTWLNEVVDLYNDMPHRTLNDFTPNQVWSDEYLQIQKQEQDEKKNIRNYANRQTFAVGSMVRVLNPKRIFEKEGETFSRDVFKVQGKDKNKYIVIDDKGVEVKRRYKSSEMLDANAPAMTSKDKITKAVSDNKANNKQRREGVDKANVVAYTRRKRTLRT